MDVFCKFSGLFITDALLSALFWKAFVMLFTFTVIIIHADGF